MLVWVTTVTKDVRLAMAVFVCVPRTFLEDILVGIGFAETRCCSPNGIRSPVFGPRFHASSCVGIGINCAPRDYRGEGKEDTVRVGVGVSQCCLFFLYCEVLGA